MTKKAKLTLIGCGPGQADLLTLRAVKRIQSAEIILYDRLVDKDVLALIPEGTICHNVGKKPGDGGKQQHDINILLHTYLSAGKQVARLKSGDPLVFGRAVEEIAIASQIPDCEYEIVPGVTSALAAASDTMLAVTERSELQNFVVTTAKSANADETPDWVSMLRPGVCIAFYMGVAQAWKIQSTLLANGAPKEIRADWVENAGKPNMRRIESQLDRLSHDAKRYDVQNPAILFLRYPISLYEAIEARKAELSTG